MAQAIVLRGGAQRMPSVGLGTWKAPAGEVRAAVTHAIGVGYRMIDCACDYGNEQEVGQGIADALEAKSVPSREDLFITSKLWNTYHRKEHVRPACERTIRDLGVGYLDLYLIHFPISLKYVPFEKRYPPEWIHDPDAPNSKMEIDPVPLQETWQALEELVRDGLVRNIGVSNFTVPLLMDLLSYATIAPAVNQVELHPYLSQESLLRFCKSSGIAVMAFSPLGAGSYVSLDMAEESESVLQDPVVQEIASSVGKTSAQVVLRWGLQRGCALVPKSSKEHRIRENMDLFNFTLSDDQMAHINGLNRNRRFNDPGEFCTDMGGCVPIYA